MAKLPISKIRVRSRYTKNLGGSWCGPGRDVRGIRGGPGPRVRNAQSINAASSCRFRCRIKVKPPQEVERGPLPPGNLRRSGFIFA